MTSVINMTPHAVTILSPVCAEYNKRTRSYNLVGDPVVVCEIPATSGNVPRCSVVEVDAEAIENIPTIGLEYGEVENLPAPEKGVFYIVSAITANAARQTGRTDLLTVARMVRKSDGSIVGCLALAR
jgi:hypothetical protein